MFSGSATLNSRAYWEQQAREKIGFVPANATMPRAIFVFNERITAAYAEMYLSDPSKFVWAGMAAFASNEVGLGLRRSEALIVEAGNPLIALGALLTNAPTGTEMIRALGTGNLDVYADIFWQHLAYSSGGIDELRNLRDRGELTAELFEAWSQIDNGQVMEGNRALLQYEQSVTLQQGVYNQHAKAFANISWMSQFMPSLLASPIPGDDVTFQAAVPGGDLGQFDDRWEWIDSSMLPAWQTLYQDSPETVRSQMEGFSSGASQGQ